MAEEDADAEISRLYQMQAQADQGSGWEDNTGSYEGEESENSDQVKEEYSADDQVLRASSPSDADVLSSVIVPQSALSVAVQSTIQAEPKSPSNVSAPPAPKKIGGFIADDSDDDEEEYVPPPETIPLDNLPPVAANGAILSRSITNSPLPTSEITQGDRSAVLRATDLTTSGSFNTSRETSSTPALRADPTLPGILSVPKARLPHDRVGILEDRIKEDPRGDLDAWISLISEHRKRNKIDDARAVYERFFKVFPSAADMWVDYAEMELGNDQFYAAEQIFGKSLLTVPNVPLWSVYLNYIRRRNDLTNDVNGTARATISQAYDFVLANVGLDRESGKLWQDYIQFIRSAPGQIGGSSWQDQQKMDQMRKAFQRAICVPMSTVNSLWKDYDQFEMGLNKMTGRKFLQEKSPAYMTARSANTALENITRGLNRSNLPRLPPALGFEGDQDYLQQVELWRRWVAWEKEDPLVFQNEDISAFKSRILYVYKQSVMALRFWPEMWVDAAEWCYLNGLEKEGNDFLSQGIAANPESCLLAFKQADRLELVLPLEEGDEGLASRGAAVRQPYDKLLDTLYELIKKSKDREAAEKARIEEAASLDAAIFAAAEKGEDDDEDAARLEKEAKETAKTHQLSILEQGFSAQRKLISRTVSFAWIALMRAMRRVQGKGKVGTPVGGSRQILNDARTRGNITSDVYVASALIEHNVYKDPAGTKIFDRGAKLFPEDDVFILEYLKHLLSTGDTTNARAVFETSVNRLAQKADLVPKAKPLYSFFHKYESEYGELAQIRKLEQRMGDLFPEDPKLSNFAARYAANGFDPTAIRLIVSSATQMRPKAIVQSIEQPMSIQGSPRPQYRVELSPRPQYRQENSPRPSFLHVIDSPKRPLGGDDSDNDSNRPRKLARGESPLKGAAGRRLDQQKRLQGAPSWQSNGASLPIPRDITFLLSILPRTELYRFTRFNADAMVKLLRQTQIPDHNAWKTAGEQPLVDQYGRDIRR